MLKVVSFLVEMPVIPETMSGELRGLQTRIATTEEEMEIAPC